MSPFSPLVVSANDYPTYSLESYVRAVENLRTQQVSLMLDDRGFYILRRLSTPASTSVGTLRTIGGQASHTVTERFNVKANSKIA